MAAAGASALESLLIATGAIAILLLSDYEALEDVALFALCTMAMALFMQFAFLPAFIVLDAYRIDSGRWDLCCFFGTPGPSRPNPMCLPQSLQSRFMASAFAGAVLSPVGQAVILVGFVVMLGVLGIGAFQLDAGLVPGRYVDRDTMAGAYLVAEDEHFRLQGIEAQVVVESHDFSTREAQLLVLGLGHAVEVNRFVQGKTVDSWLESFLRWTSDTGRVLRSGDSARFHVLLDEFLATDGGQRYEQDLVPRPGEPTQCRIRFLHEPVPASEAEKRGQLVRAIRKSVDRALDEYGANGAAVVTAIEYELAEQAEDLRTEATELLFLQFLVVLVGSLLFLVHTPVGLLVSLTSAAVLINYFGALHYWHLRLDPLTLFGALMTLGVYIDHVLPVGRAFGMFQGTRRERVQKTLGDAGSATLSGAVCALVCAIALIFADNPFFEVLLRIIVIVVLLSVAHAILLMPVLLYQFGPETTVVQDDTRGLDLDFVVDLTRNDKAPPASREMGDGQAQRDGDDEFDDLYPYVLALRERQEAEAEALRKQRFYNMDDEERALELSDSEDSASYDDESSDGGRSDSDGSRSGSDGSGSDGSRSDGSRSGEATEDEEASKDDQGSETEEEGDPEPDDEDENPDEPEEHVDHEEEEKAQEPWEHVEHEDASETAGSAASTGGDKSPARSESPKEEPAKPKKRVQIDAPRRGSDPFQITGKERKGGKTSPASEVSEVSEVIE